MKDFQNFHPRTSDAIYLTKNPEFASQFAKHGAYNPIEKNFSWDEARQIAGENAAPNVMPLHVRSENPFDYENPHHVDAVLKKLNLDELSDDDIRSIRDELPTGDWETIENPIVQKAIRSLGHDGFFINEFDHKNLGVYEPSQVKSAIGNNGNFDREEEDITKSEGGDVEGHYARENYEDGGAVDEPQKTVKAYKLFRTNPRKPGQLFPLFVDADTPVPIGKWVAAKAGDPGKDPKKVKSKLGDLAYRPGWHSGDLPVATHIGGRSHKDPKLPPDYRPDNQVWAEVEVPDDVDWQSVANSRMEYTKTGKPKPATAHITDQVPVGGHYRYKTNPNMTGNWIISGGMKVNRVLSDDEVKAINDQAGVADLPRLPKEAITKADGGDVEGRIPYDDPQYAKNLKKFHGKTPDVIKGTKWYHGTDKNFQSFMTNRAGHIFVTPDTEFANRYARGSWNHDDLQEAYEGAQHYKIPEPQPNILPVHVRAEKPFDYENPKHLNALVQELGPDLIMDPHLWKFVQEVREGHWGAIESSPIQNAIKALGHDSFFVKEDGVKNLGLYDPSQIKSATGNNGNFDTSEPDITKAEGGEIIKPAYRPKPQRRPDGSVVDKALMLLSRKA